MAIHAPYRAALAVMRALELAGHPSRLAGGCVRDRLLGILPNDYDIATTALPDVVMSTCAAKGWKAIPTGIDHGTVTVVAAGAAIEVTTLRRDVETDGRHARVEFGGTSFAEDAGRRDFTFNALYEDSDGRIYDFVGGRDDLQARTLRFVGDPRLRIQEDYLRILRFYRFWARFACRPSADALTAIEELHAGLAAVSQERITSELRAILAVPHLPRELVLHFAASGVKNSVLLCATEIDERRLAVVESLESISDNLRPLLRLALLITPDNATPANAAAVGSQLEVEALRLKLSRAETRIVRVTISALANVPEINSRQSAFLLWAESIEHESATPVLHSGLWTFWTALSEHLLAWHGIGDRVNRAVQIDSQFGFLRRQPMPVNGRDVMTADPSLSGKDIGLALAELRRGYLDQEWSERAEALALMRAGVSHKE